MNRLHSLTTKLAFLKGLKPSTRSQKRALRNLATQRHKRIIVGSEGRSLEGWTATDIAVLDLTREETWLRFFQDSSVDAILAEHVWEHLSPDEAVRSAAVCYRFLKPGGYLRVAVPDGLHPDPAYIDSVKPGGSGSGAWDHKVLYRYDSLRDIFANTGFIIRLYEYFDENGNFHFEEWNTEDGMVVRSKRFDPRNAGGVLAYTSIVLDAVKPDHAGKDWIHPAG